MADHAGALTITELVDTAHLGLTFLAGEAGKDRSVLWVHVSDLEDPAAWLDGGELLITNGLGLPPDAAGQVEYLAHLDERRAAGLAIGVRNPELHDSFLAEADRRQFPVLRIAQEVPFQAVSRLVAAAGHDDASRRLQVHLRIFDTLFPRAIGRYGPIEMFDRLEKLTGYELYLVTKDGYPVLNGMDSLPKRVAVQLALSDEDSPNLSGAVVVRLPLRPHVDAFVVALEKPRAVPTGRAAVRHVATVAALEIAEAQRTRAEHRRRGSEVLSGLVSGRLDSADAERRMAGFGLLPAAPVLFLAVTELTSGAVDELHYRLSDRRVPHLLLADETALFVVPADVATLTAAVDGLRLVAGMSLVRAGLADWATARREALWAMGQASAASRTGLAPFVTDEAAVSWMPTDTASLAELVERNLGPLLRYDQEKNTELVRSLRVYFAQERQLTAAAGELVIHKHTLSYRLRRIEEITGRDLSTMKDLTDLWLSLKAMDALNLGLESPT